MNIAGRSIGPGHAPYIIAEIGVNHDGEPAKALALIDAAADAGADAVKFQMFDADLLMSRAAKLAAYQRAAGERDPVEMLRRLQLSAGRMEALAARAHARGVHAIVTVFSVELVEHAARLPWDAYKTASPDIIHRPLLDALMATGRPLIISTGASTLDEVQRAALWLAAARARTAYLQSVSCYPTPVEHAELAGIGALTGLGAAVGYSDHTPDVQTGALAVEAGAQILEKHFTLDRRAHGPDHAASLEPRDFAEYARRARAARPGSARGGVKRVLPIERDVRAVSRQSLVTTRDLPEGHVLTRGDVTFKRPGTGVPPWELGACLGARLSCAVEADMPITHAALKPAAASV